MTLTITDLTHRIESNLPALPAGMVRLGSAAASKGAETLTVASSKVTSAGSSIAKANLRAARTVIGQTRSSIERTVEFAGNRIAEARGQAISQTSRAAKSTNTALVDLVDDTVDQFESVKPLAGLTKAELYEMAQNADIAGRSDMTKRELVDALSA